MKRLRVAAVLLALMMALTAASGADMTAADRVQQAKAYQEEGRLEDALTALEFAQALAPDALDVIRLQVEVLTQMDRPDDALALLDEHLKRNPARPELHLYRARVMLAKQEQQQAADALRRAVVACGGDQCFSSQYAPEYKDLLWQVAEGEVDARRYDQALQLFSLLPPSDDNAAYQRALASRAQGQPGSWQPIPGVHHEAFLEALAEDRVTLAPVMFSMDLGTPAFMEEARRYDDAVTALGGEPVLTRDLDGVQGEVIIDQQTIYENMDFLTVSPDGRTVLAIDMGVPVVFSVAEGFLRVIAPDAAMQPEYYDRLYSRLIQRPEDAGAAWSPDGRYLALSFPRVVLASMRLGANIILIDLEAGTAAVVDKALEINLSAGSVRDMPDGAPVRAAFSLDGQHLLYEVILAEDDEPGAQLRSMNLDTKAVTILARYSMRSLNLEGGFADTPAGILQTVSDTAMSGDYGLVLRTPEGDRRFLRNGGDAFGQLVLPQLHEVRGDSGLLRTWIGPPHGITSRLVIQPFRPSEMAVDAYDTAWAIDPEQEAFERLTLLNLKQALDGAPNIDPGQLEPLRLADNAALSPDGSMALLHTQAMDRTDHQLYLYDMASGTAGRVAVEGVGEDSAFGRYQPPANSAMLRGLRWLGGNRLLVEVDAQYRLFKLTISE